LNSKYLLEALSPIEMEPDFNPTSLGTIFMLCLIIEVTTANGIDFQLPSLSSIISSKTKSFDEEDIGVRKLREISLIDSASSIFCKTNVFRLIG
jgi:hypothetical protein